MATPRGANGDAIDSACFAFYGSPTGFTEIVLDANPDLAFEPAFRPPALRVELPERAQIQPQAGFTLWE